jgi:hypothetical protein
LSNFHLKITYLFIGVVFCMSTKAQLFTKLGNHHNQFFVGAGYSESFVNTSYGINHTRYFKCFKRDIIGILDFSSPLSYKCYTRFIFRKGFQFDVYKKNNFKLPIAIISSSVSKHLYLFNFHDIITNLCLMPGIYTEKFTLAADVAANFLLMQKTHFKDAYNKEGVTKVDAKTERVNISAGIILAYNIHHFSFIFKGGFQQVTHWEWNKTPIYAVGILAFKLNFKKHPVN